MVDYCPICYDGSGDLVPLSDTLNPDYYYCDRCSSSIYCDETKTMEEKYND